MKQKILSETIYHKIIALSKTEVGKLNYAENFQLVEKNTGQVLNANFFGMTVENEIKLLKIANAINDLFVKFIRVEDYDSKNKLIVLERLYPIPFNYYKLNNRKKLFLDFKIKIKELHENSFIHGDLLRPRYNPPECFSNIVLTKKGILLIDSGFSKLNGLNSSEEEFNSLLYQETQEINSFEEYFLNSLKG
ncbi:MAG: hypothetical protein SFU98_07195 [Leptospiraceae bacterium]|nr:hypothetical protein [Leptospiraceae bacterium]